MNGPLVPVSNATIHALRRDINAHLALVMVSRRPWSCSGFGFTGSHQCSLDDEDRFAE
jgi:hypothetical protein